MTRETNLTLIKGPRTLVWHFFNGLIFYMLFAALTGWLDRWLWLGFGLLAAEGIVLLGFNFFCPLTILARRYSDSTADNFDIYLSNWLARNSKRIYTSLVLVIILITAYGLLN